MTENSENPENANGINKEIPHYSTSELFSKTYSDFQIKYTQNIQKEKKFIRIGLWVILISLILEILSLFPGISRPPPDFDRYMIDRKLWEFLLFLLTALLIFYQMTIFNSWHKQSKEIQSSIIRLTFKINNDSNKVILSSAIVLIINVLLAFSAFQEIWKPPIPNMRAPPFEAMHYASSINILVFWILEAILLTKWSKKFQNFNRMVKTIESELDIN